MMLVPRANEFSPENERSQSMEHAEAQALFRKFAAPLAGYAATSPPRQALAEMLARNLWMAMIAGPAMEEEMWKVFQKRANLDDDSLQPIKQLYFEQMKSVITDEQIAALRQRYRLRRQE
jgi:hypothetical protein